MLLKCQPSRWHFYFIMNIHDCFKIGYILKPHGLRGEVTLSLDPSFETTGTPDAIFLEQNGQMVPYLIESISVRGDKAFVKFEDIDTPEAAADISRTPAYLPKAMRPERAEDEFYDDEINGFDVVDATAGAIGKVVGIVAAGPNRLVSVAGEKEVLIPVNAPFITNIDHSERVLSVDLPDGFLDI